MGWRWWAAPSIYSSIRGLRYILYILTGATKRKSISNVLLGETPAKQLKMDAANREIALYKDEYSEDEKKKSLPAFGVQLYYFNKSFVKLIV